MADSSDTSFLTALQSIRGAGQFCAHGSLPFVPPGIVLKNGEDLALPLNAAQAAALRALAEPAPYGMGEETRLDDTVRKCWQVDASELLWSFPRWQACLESLVTQVTEELGIEGKVSAEPYKLLMYDTGGFFLPHRDTEKLPGMFGSLIVCLPSRHSGGELVLRHQGREQQVDFGSEFDPSVIRWAAFFADCEHEVLPVTSGHRLCLTYNLVLVGGQSKTPTAPVGGTEALLPGLLHIAQTRGDDITAILLEHRYTQESLSVAALKGDDRARAAALFSAAEPVGLTARLALVSLYQRGELDEDAGHTYYSQRRRGSRRNDEEVDGEMGEIFEQNLTIEHWRTPDDQKENFGRFEIMPKNLLSLASLGEGEPDEKFAEGYTGNAGCTMQHWYRRAAICVWSQAAGPVLLARYDFCAACQSFATLAKKGGVMATQHAWALINEARKRLFEANEWEAEALARQVRPLLRGIGELGDEALYEKITKSNFAMAFLKADRDTWAALLRGFSSRPLDHLQAQTPSGPISVHRQTWFCAVDAMLSQAPALLPRYAELLPRLVAGQVLTSRIHSESDAAFTKPSYQAHLVLAASCEVRSEPACKELEAWLLQNGRLDLDHLRNVLAPALLDKTHHAWFKKDHSLVLHVLAVAIQRLATETTRRIEPYPDQRRPAPTTTSSDPLIHALLVFMADPTASVHEIRRAQADRSSMEEYVKRHDLDLDLHTEYKGRPHTLVCRKNDHSYHQALNQRVADETLLERLRELKIR